MRTNAIDESQDIYSDIPELLESDDEILYVLHNNTQERTDSENEEQETAATHWRQFEELSQVSPLDFFT